MPRVTEATVRRLLEDEEFQGLSELVELPDDQVVPILTELMSKSRDPLVRQRCAIALGMIGSAEAAPALTERLNDRSVPVVISAITALGRLKATGSADRVAELLRSRDASVRQAAAEALGVMALPQSEEPLTELLADEEEEFVREQAARSLREIQRRAGANP